MKTKIQIKSWHTNSVLFEFETENNTIKKTVEEAVRLNADLSFANLYKANLSNADLSFANLFDADLSFANLSYADLSFANLFDADLSFANLFKADLSKANLSNADLSYADLSFANLSYADLSFANLFKADLSKANLSNADLSNANLSFANLYKAKNWENTNWCNKAKQNILFILSCLPNEIQGLKEKLISGQVDGSQYEGDCCCLVGSLGKLKKTNADQVCNIIPFYSKGTDNLGEQFFLNIKEGDTPENNKFSKIAVELCDLAIKMYVK